MLEDEINGLDLLSDLHYEDAVVISNAKTILSTAPIGTFIKGDNSDKVWFEKSIIIQEKLLNLKTRIDYLVSQYQTECYKLEGQALKSSEYEYIRSRDERIARLYCNEQELVDSKLTVDKLKCVSSYIDGLLWSIRDLLKLFK